MQPHLHCSVYIDGKNKNNLLILTLIYLLTAVVLTPGDSSTVHIYTQTIHRTTQLTTLVGRLSGIRTQSGQTKINNELTAWKLSPNWEECRRCPIFASYTLAFALQLRKKHRKTTVRVAKECHLTQWKQNIQHRTHIIIIHKRSNKNTQLTKLNKCIPNIELCIQWGGKKDERMS